MSLLELLIITRNAHAARLDANEDMPQSPALKEWLADQRTTLAEMNAEIARRISVQ